MLRTHHNQNALRSMPSMVMPPLVSTFIKIKDVKTGTSFPPPAFYVVLDTTDILTKSFFNKFYDLVSLKLLDLHLEPVSNRQIWMPISGVKLSVSFRDYDCDWPLLAVIPYPENTLILFSTDSGLCSSEEFALVVDEYKTKIPTELYLKIKGSRLISRASRSNPAQL